MKTIVIAGCSWGAGEWNANDITHSGLAEYFLKDGFNVVNLSQPNTGPWQLLKTLHNFIKINKNFLNIQHVFFLQSDIARDFEEFQHKITWHHTLNLENNIKRIYRQFYIHLNFVGKDCQTTIQLIGGLADLILDYKNEFKYLNFLIPSWTKLIDHTISSVFLLKVDKIPEGIKNNNKEELITLVDQSLTRFKIFDKNKEYFWPDGCHPNRSGHYVLYNAIKTNLNL
jgi:hypothetical protein